MNIKHQLTRTNLAENQKNSGINSKKEKTGSQPPQNIRTHKADIINMLQYSAKKKNANITEEYSTLYPETSSDSASGRSKGGRLVSATEEIKKITLKGKNGKTKKQDLWASTISVKFNEFDNITIGSIVKNIEIS